MGGEHQFVGAGSERHERRPHQGAALEVEGTDDLLLVEQAPPLLAFRPRKPRKIDDGQVEGGRFRDRHLRPIGRERGPQRLVSCHEVREGRPERRRVEWAVQAERPGLVEGQGDVVPHLGGGPHLALRLRGRSDERDGRSREWIELDASGS